MKAAFFDPVGGISGDMTLAALIDAGADPAELVRGLKTLALPDWELELDRTVRCSLAAQHVEVLVGGKAAGAASMVRAAPADAPVEAPSTAEAGHAHGPSSEPGELHTHTHSGHSHTETSAPAEGTHSHTHSGHDHTGHSHTHGAESHTHGGGEARGSTHDYASVDRLISTSGLPDRVKDRARSVYRKLAEAEARAHGMELDEVHFHEVGAVDSIVDVVGAVYALDLLGVDRIICAPLPMGHGFVRCDHGQMPVPPPATAYLLEGCPVRRVEIAAELVTPTGAALASALVNEWGHMPAGVIRRVGCGAGSRDFPFPNILRVFLMDLDQPPSGETAQVTLIEANIDDMSPQLLSAAASELLEAGALDVWITPVLMKKGRPGHTLHLLAPPEQQQALAERLLAVTSTIGVRFSRWDRLCLERDWFTVETPYGAVRVKRALQGGRVVNLAPEFDDCENCSRESGAPVKVVHQSAMAAALRAQEETK